MSDQLLALTDLIYDAASGGTPWAVVGKGLERLVNARSASLMAGDFKGGSNEILYHAEIPTSAVAAYQQHYRSVDLWTNRAAQAASTMSPDQASRVWTSGHLVPDSEFLRGELYNDFGRHLGLRYVVGTVVHLGAAGVMPRAFTGQTAPQPSMPTTLVSSRLFCRTSGEHCNFATSFDPVRLRHQRPRQHSMRCL